MFLSLMFLCAFARGEVDVTKLVAARHHEDTLPFCQL